MIGSTQPSDQRLSIPAAKQDTFVVDTQEQAVARGSGASTGAAEALEERRDGAGGADLDDAVQVADVDAEFQRRGGDDDGVAGFGERRFGAAPLLSGQ